MSNAGYGFGLNTVVAGVVLVRFSALGSFSGKLTPRLRERIVALVLLGGGSVVVLVAFAVFASASHSSSLESCWPSPQKGRRRAR